MSNQLKKTIVLTAAYYGQQIQDAVLKMYIEDLSDINLDDVLQAYTSYRKNPRNRRFPLPADIRDIIYPEITAADEAREAAARIKQAVTKFGWANKQAARTFIGELGWTVVERFGGWQYLCETIKDSMWPILTAQMRDLAMTVSKRTQSGLGDIAPGLPEPMKPKIDQQKQRELAMTIKELSEKKSDSF